MARICLIACVRLKDTRKMRAGDIYISPLFKKAREFASKNFDRWYILSAKYGLVHPDTIIEPYEKTLNKMSRNDRQAWSEDVFEKLKKCTKVNDEIAFVAGLRYRQDLTPLLQKRGNKIWVPMEGMGIGKQLKWLKEQNYAPNRKTHLKEFYSILKDLENALGSKRVLSECNGKMKWPERGVYFFFEHGEYRSCKPNDLRVVRVGTHMVSKDSNATFWNRLRTHRGTEYGSGNHRASIFRLHIGEAIIRKSNGDISVPTWRKEQVASAEVRKHEESLEKQVSKHIGGLPLLWLEVPDRPGPDSDRAYIERNSIGLLSGLGNPLDIPSKNWLGNFSSCDSIRKSGLWNVNHVVYRYDSRFLSVLRNYVECAAGKCLPPKKSIAPKDWYLADKGKDSIGQMFLFSEG